MFPEMDLYMSIKQVQIQEVMNLLMRTYVPKPYTGKVTLFSIIDNLL